MQYDLFQTAISSQQDIPASHSPLPGSSEAQKMTAISGQKYLPLCEKNSLAGAFSRMFLATLPWASTRCYLTWKVKATPAGRRLSQQVVSVRTTDAPDSTGAPWPTPTARDHKDSTGMVAKRSDVPAA